ncbi:hypothetical protein DV735_g5760, partial [Chaetothyriales sp. CBS 134920]
MPRQTPHSQTIFHLVPHKASPRAKQMLLHPDNEPFVSLCKATKPGEEDEYGLEIGYHVSARPRALVIVEVGKNADLVMPGSSISQVHFSFEVHPESRHIMFLDRSRLHSTKIKPEGFRADGNFRQLVLQPETEYQISAGGEKVDQFVFYLRWLKEVDDALYEVEKESQIVEARGQNPRWARTVEDTPTDLPTWYNTRLHTPAIGAVQRTIDAGPLGKGAFGEVRKAVDCDSGCFIAVKKIELPPRVEFAVSNEEVLLRREVKVLSSISHKNIVEYLGSSGWDTGIVNIYMSLKPGNICDLLEKTPSVRTSDPVITRLWHEMLEALDYLAFRGWIHRDVKLENILYTPSGDDNYLFQLADFGLANQQQLAKTQCGSPLYMAPEVMYRTHEQSPKVDVWSLFVVIGIVTQAGSLHPRLARYEDVLKCVRAAAAQHKFLSPMAQEDPGLRASAAQMLVKYFNGEGMSTPWHQVGRIPDHASAPEASQASEQRSSGPRPQAPPPLKPAVGDLKRLNNASPKLLFARSSIEAAPYLHSSAASSLRPRPPTMVRNQTRVRSYTDKKDPSVPSPSASVILISPTNTVLLLHRKQTSSAFPSAHVFPGGNLDASDGELPPSPTDVSDAARLHGRKAVHANQLTFQHWLAQQSASAILHTDGLVPFTHWVTPANVPKRFTTQMYIYFVHLQEADNPSIHATSDGIETMHPEYKSAREWIRLAQAGDVILFPPHPLLDDEDGRIALKLDRPGPELEGSGLVGDDSLVVLTKFQREGPRRLEQ